MTTVERYATAPARGEFPAATPPRGRRKRERASARSSSGFAPPMMTADRCVWSLKSSTNRRKDRSSMMSVSARITWISN